MRETPGLFVGIYYAIRGSVSSLLWIRDEPKGKTNFKWIKFRR